MQKRNSKRKEINTIQESLRKKKSKKVMTDMLI
jgi:hypothetical protein